MLSFTPLSDATEAVSLKAVLWPRKLVPGWNEAYDESERARNRASRRLRSFPVEGYSIGVPKSNGGGEAGH